MLSEDVSNASESWFLKAGFGFMLEVKFQMRLQSKQWRTSTGKFMQWMELLILSFQIIILFQDY